MSRKRGAAGRNASPAGMLQPGLSPSARAIPPRNRSVRAREVTETLLAIQADQPSDDAQWVLRSDFTAPAYPFVTGAIREWPKCHPAAKKNLRDPALRSPRIESIQAIPA